MQLVAEVDPARCFEEGEEVLVAVQLVAQSGDLAVSNAANRDSNVAAHLLSSYEWLAVSTGHSSGDGS